MTAYIVLDDGRELSRSNAGIAGLLHLTAEQVPEAERDLKLWLADLSGRPSGFMDIDLRGLTSEHRAAFHAAARRAMDELQRSGFREWDASVTANALQTLLRMKESIDRGEPPLTLSDSREVSAFSGDPEDIFQIWNSDLVTQYSLDVYSSRVPDDLNVEWLRALSAAGLRCEFQSDFNPHRWQGYLAVRVEFQRRDDLGAERYGPGPLQVVSVS